MITYEDGSEKAFRALKACACKHGGNALIIERKDEVFARSNDGALPHQMKVAITATVVYLKPI
jgi:hypothetical protein